MSKQKCNLDCFNCTYKDCINSSLSLSDYSFSRNLDNDIKRDNTLKDLGVGSRKNRKPYTDKYYRTHKKEQLKRCKEYRDNNPEKRKETTKAYREKNRDLINEKARKSYYDNLEEQRMKKRLYYQQHKEEINRKRRERRLQNALT